MNGLGFMTVFLLGVWMVMAFFVYRARARVFSTRYHGDRHGGRSRFILNFSGAGHQGPRMDAHKFRIGQSVTYRSRGADAP